MARGLWRWWNFLEVAKNTFGGSSDKKECRLGVSMIPTYVRYFVGVGI